MGRSPTEQSSSTNRIDNPCSLISESLNDVGLPPELIIEILVRLPVKSLLKSRCVSKSWLSLISSPQFTRSHFSTADQYLNSQVLFTTFPPTCGIKQFSLYSALYEPSANVSDIEYPSQKPDDQYPWIAGIVNGLVCLVFGNGLFLWNPVLRKSKVLPIVAVKGNPYVAYGFGYDESNDDYKVVSLEFRFSSDHQTEVMVYSLLRDSWTKIDDDFKGGFPLQCSGQYADGKIHWAGATSSSSSAQGWKIASLDMVGHRYGEVHRPYYEAGVSCCAFRVLGGRLFVLCGYDKKKADLWVMDKYGVEESWSKVLSVPYNNTPSVSQ